MLEDDYGFEDIISRAFNIQVFSYNGKVTSEFWSVLRLMGSSKDLDQAIFNTEIAEATGLTESHVELIQYLICNNDHADYGTSPRGCWLTEKGFDVYRELKNIRSAQESGKETK